MGVSLYCLLRKVCTVDEIMAGRLFPQFAGIFAGFSDGKGKVLIFFF